MISIQEILRLFGITRCYKGFKHTEFSIALAVSEEDRLEAVTKEIYMETASHFNCKWTAVERNIENCNIKCERKRKPPDALFFYHKTGNTGPSAIL